MSAATASRLPTEIYYQTISYIRNPTDLISLLHVSRASHAEAERHLYYNLDFFSFSSSRILAGPALNCMTLTPRLFMHVQSLSVLYRHHFADELVAALYEMKNLKHLNIQFGFVYHRQRVVWGVEALPPSVVSKLGLMHGLILPDGTTPRMPFRLESFRTDHWGNMELAAFFRAQRGLKRLDWQSGDTSPTMLSALETSLLLASNSPSGAESDAVLRHVTTLSTANLPILLLFLEKRPGQIQRVELLNAMSAGFADWWAGRWDRTFEEIRSLRMMCHRAEDLARLARLKERAPKLLFFETAGSERQPHEYSETLNCIADFPCLVKAKINLNLGDHRAEKLALHLMKRRPTLEEVEIGSGRQWEVYKRQPRINGAIQTVGAKHVGEIEGFRVERKEGQTDYEEWLRW